MFIADSHCDTLWVLLKGKTPKELMVNKEKMLLGGMGMHTFALFTGSKGTHGSAYKDGIDMLACRDLLDIKVYTKRLPDEPPKEPFGVISIEGGEALEGSIERLYEFYELSGVRMIALTWNYENEIGFPAKLGSEPGLKPFGKELLSEMDKLGIYADVSHLNEAGFWDIYENMSLPPIASHSNNRELCDVPRNLNRKQIEAIIERNGYIGINFYTDFLVKEEEALIDDVIRHIDSICEIGGEKVLGFGSDFDGIDSWPKGLGGSDCFPALIEAMEKRGYARKTIENIAGGNLWRLLKTADERRKY